MVFDVVDLFWSFGIGEYLLTWLCLEDVDREEEKRDRPRAEARIFMVGVYAEYVYA